MAVIIQIITATLIKTDNDRWTMETYFSEHNDFIALIRYGARHPHDDILK